VTRAVLVALAALAVHAAAAQELKTPTLSLATVDWEAAAAGVSDRAPGTPAQAFAALNAATKARFPDLDKSRVPVLMPLDIDELRKQQAAGKPDLLVDNFARGGFHPTAFFQAGPAGFDTAFSLRAADVGELSDIRYADPIYVLFSGFGMTYELDGPPLPQGEPVKDLEPFFPGIKRYLHESYVRYAFERYGVTYVAAIYCLDTRPRAKILACKQADLVAQRFLKNLVLVGGAPAPARKSVEPIALDRPQAESKDFTYFSPGSLIPRTGLRPGLDGRADYTVYAHLRFPMKQAPDFANSQSFNNWGDCDFTGRSRSVHSKGGAYSCKVNGRPLAFDESLNYTYPWRDNFCEHRRFFVGQCPGGEGHQGQDIRPSSCTLFNSGADRCLPYQHDVVAVHDGTILRARKQEAVYLFINTADTHLRVRYMHMNPNQLDEAGIVSGKDVKEGDTLGKVGNYNNGERGTTYHLHFDMQVATKVGYVFVNPYMSLVTAYERLIGGRGTEITDPNATPVASPVPPIIEHPDIVPAVAAAPAPAQAEAHAGEPPKAEPVKAEPTKQAAAEPLKEKEKETVKRKAKNDDEDRPRRRRHVHHHRRHRHQAAAND
jgi:murein DD-endopeptidase MepM/ murein hydrolase activator NlpD